jgi:bifunctional enzyme CysN/CysC
MGGVDGNRALGTLWLTGLPAAGKTTIARATELELTRSGRQAWALDGDELRKGISADLGLERADRAEQARRAAHLAVMVAQRGIVPIVALVSPFAADRRQAREIHDDAGIPFYEIWIDTPLDVCEQRDPKGLYARARTGSITGLTGRDAPYEAPSAPDLRVAGYGTHPDVIARRLAGLLASAPAEPRTRTVI